MKQRIGQIEILSVKKFKKTVPYCRFVLYNSYTSGELGELMNFQELGELGQTWSNSVELEFRTRTNGRPDKVV